MVQGCGQFRESQVRGGGVGEVAIFYCFKIFQKFFQKSIDKSKSLVYNKDTIKKEATTNEAKQIISIPWLDNR